MNDNQPTNNHDAAFPSTASDAFDLEVVKRIGGVVQVEEAGEAAYWIRAEGLEDLVDLRVMSSSDDAAEKVYADWRARWNAEPPVENGVRRVWCERVETGIQRFALRVNEQARPEFRAEIARALNALCDRFPELSSALTTGETATADPERIRELEWELGRAGEALRLRASEGAVGDRLH